MPKYGLLTNPIYDTAKQVNDFGKLGFDYTELNFEEPYGTPKMFRKNRKKILAALKKNKMFALAHSAFWVDFGTSHENVRDGWIREAKDMIRICPEFNIRKLNFHFYPGNGGARRVPEGREAFMRNFINSMKDLTEFGRKNNVTIMLENLDTRGSHSYKLEDFTYVVEHVPNLKVHLDVGHAFIEGGNKMVEQYTKRFADEIVHVHVHDNHGKKDEHLPIGAGKVNFKKAIANLKKIGYDDTITFEVFTSNKDAQKSRNTFDRMWNKS